MANAEINQYLLDCLRTTLEKLKVAPEDILDEFERVMITDKWPCTGNQNYWRDVKRGIQLDQVPDHDIILPNFLNAKYFSYLILKLQQILWSELIIDPAEIKLILKKFIQQIDNRQDLLTADSIDCSETAEPEWNREEDFREIYGHYCRADSFVTDISDQELITQSKILEEALYKLLTAMETRDLSRSQQAQRNIIIRRIERKPLSHISYTEYLSNLLDDIINLDKVFSELDGYSTSNILELPSQEDPAKDVYHKVYRQLNQKYLFTKLQDKILTLGLAELLMDGNFSDLNSLDQFATKLYEILTTSDFNLSVSLEDLQLMHSVIMSELELVLRPRKIKAYSLQLPYCDLEKEVNLLSARADKLIRRRLIHAHVPLYLSEIVPIRKLLRNIRDIMLERQFNGRLIRDSDEATEEYHRHLDETSDEESDIEKLIAELEAEISLKTDGKIKTKEKERLREVL